MASKGGVGIDVDVARVPLREADMEPFEIMVSESQERMLCVVEPERVAEVLAVCERWETRATAIGEVTGGGLFRVLHDERVVGEMPVAALVDDCPLYDLQPRRPERQIYGPPARSLTSEEPQEVLLALLASPNIASRRPLFEQYDCVVQSRTVRRPEQADAAVLRIDPAAAGDATPASPEASLPALAVSIDGNGRRVACDPYRGAVEAVLECAANLACVGAEPLGLTNCLNFGNPEKPHVAWQMTEAVRGLADACRLLEVPVVGGNVSLYNETAGGPIYPTPVVGMVGELPDAARGRRAGLRRRRRRDRAGRPLRPGDPRLRARAPRWSRAARRPARDRHRSGARHPACRPRCRARRRPAQRARHRRGRPGGRGRRVLPGGRDGGAATVEPRRRRRPRPSRRLFGEGPGGFIVSGPGRRSEALGESARP